MVQGIWLNLSRMKEKLRNGKGSYPLSAKTDRHVTALQFQKQRQEQLEW